MIGTIGYLGKVSPLTGIYSALLYTLGTTIGAALVGLILSMLGYSLHWLFGTSSQTRSPVILVPIAILSLIGGLRDLGFLRFSLPQPPKQLPKGWWQVLGPYRTSLLWGMMVGLYFKTRVQFTIYYVVALWILLAGNCLLGMLILGLYGFSHGFLLVIETIVNAVDHGNKRFGLFGHHRTDFLYRFVGATMLACGIYLIAQSTVI